MYTSIRAHLENGQVIFDEPVQAEDVTHLIVTLLSNPLDQKAEIKKSFKELLLEAPTWSEKEYQEFLENKSWGSESRLNK
ncbi:MAG: hypothetical protein K2Q22_11140 [Cytophagales bacterium]|nr:hypothetical protein [Cytophagales bacterium]